MKTQSFPVNPANLREFAESYGVAVRAGLITPNIDDENHARELFGLPPANESVVAEWKRTDGVRAPITISGGTSQNDAINTGGQSNEPSNQV